ncbi:MAG: hypothetical protein P4L53_21300 [Candidatus Obscuribacterales bacterium]|nr:hypothetical protein [Candidatus Obscuribacterales bacterium]
MIPPGDTGDALQQEEARGKVLSVDVLAMIYFFMHLAITGFFSKESTDFVMTSVLVNMLMIE